MKPAILVLAGAAILAAIAVAAAPPAANKVQFTDVTAQAGIKFVHNAGKVGQEISA